MLRDDFPRGADKNNRSPEKRKNANGLTNPDVFYPIAFLIPRGIIPQNFCSLRFAVLEELGKKQTNKQTNWNRITLECKYVHSREREKDSFNMK